jgi:tight adherence protein B
MTGLALALAAAYGVFLVFTAVVFGWTGLGPGSRSTRRPAGRRPTDLLVQAGLDIRRRELVAVVAALFLLGALLGWALFGGLLPGLAGGVFGASFPLAGARAERERCRAAARESWPRLIEEIRIKTTALGRSIPQALLDVAATAPAELQPAFDAARREWLLSTDFERCTSVLKAHLADPTADTVCETLLVAHDIGGAEVDRCLVALVDDRVMDQQSRKDARARQAGARFARRFVVIVPLGMALVGLSIGEGRAAYEAPAGQVLVVTAIALMAGCWLWAGQIMRLPPEARIFAPDGDGRAGGMIDPHPPRGLGGERR